jgi:hypothetical protein
VGDSAGAPDARAAVTNRSELLFWAVTLAICVSAGIVTVVTTHRQHSDGYMRPSATAAGSSMLGQAAVTVRGPSMRHFGPGFLRCAGAADVRVGFLCARVR